MEPSPDPDALTVTVVRSGGIAGMRREWQAHPAAAERGRWQRMIAACVWEPAPAPAPGADRFAWRVHVVDGGDERVVELADAGLDDGWRSLIDAVRDWRAD